MRRSHDMCCALDMRCGAGGDFYHIEFAKQTYRIRETDISNLPRQIYRQKWGAAMTERKDVLREESIDFAIQVSDACDEIKNCSVFVNQLVRCSSSIGANIHEARYAQSRADFISKLEIALKESSETDYWLELLYRKKKLSPDRYHALKIQCGTIRRKLIASVTTAKANRQS